MEKRKLDITLLLFCITALGYAVSYSYEFGIKQYYQLPISFVNIDLITITRNSILLAIVLVPGVFFSTFYEESDLKKMINNIIKISFPKKSNFFIQFLFLLGAIISLILWGKSEDVFHYIYSPSFGTFLFLYVLAKKYKQSSILIFLVMILVYSYSIGHMGAKNKEKYLAIPETDLIVIDYHDKNVILAKVDFINKVIYPEYQFLNVETSEINTLKFELINTGKLKVLNVIERDGVSDCVMD